MLRRFAYPAAVWLALAVSGWAAPDLPLPAGATMTRETETPGDTARLPSGPFSDGEIPFAVVEGTIYRAAWRVPRQDLTPLQLITPVRDALADQGYDVVYACEARGCGGFDFRFAMHLIPEPEMHVDLGDYRYLLAHRDSDAGSELTAIVASRSAEAAFLHATVVTPGTATSRPSTEDVRAAMPLDAPDEAPPPADLAARLLAEGHAPLEGLRFASGAASLSDETYPAVEALAAFLRDRPGARVLLVGHTDAVGGLADNTRLSRARAEAVRRRLIGQYDIPTSQVAAEGAGYLAPRAPNLTPEDRARNRRVEAVLLSLE